MTVTKFGFVALPVVWMALVTATPFAAQGKSVNDGVYSEAQATRGAGSYAKECASCHGDGLEGNGYAPALVGSEFMSSWNGTTVGDLFERIRQSMPPGATSSVSAKDKADIVAHLLKASKFPAGQAELAADAAALKDIKFELPK